METPCLVAACLCVLLALCVPCCAATYHVSADGNDDADGLTPETAWRTLVRVHAADIRPGDQVLFRRGDTWRGSLMPRNGEEGRPVLYGAYGEGDKPVLMGSVSKSRPEDWRSLGDSLWVAGETPPRPEPTLTDDPNALILRWGLYTEYGASMALTPHPTDPRQLQVDCREPGSHRSDAQLIASGLSLEAGQTYRIAFRALATAPTPVAMPALMMARPPWSSYSVAPPLDSRRLDASWRTCVQYYTADTTTDQGRLTFFLGGALPAGATLYLRDMAWSPCPRDEVPFYTDDALPVDVGNIILGDEAEAAVKVWEREDLKRQGQFWYDEENHVVVMYSDTNPAERYGKLECALHRHIINEGRAAWVTYENLWLKYGGAHGIGGGDTHHITVRDCDLCWIGGADQMGGANRVRYGNGIEFWGAAHDNLVERCRLWQIYDAALTNQNAGAVVAEYNITYRDNTIWLSEYSFEYWNRPAESETYNIQFINNKCLDAGFGWSHSQRADPNGRHLCLYFSDAKAHDIIIRDNIFCEASTNAFYAPDWSAEQLAALKMGGNLWFQAEGDMVWVNGKRYTMDQFAQFQQETGLDATSKVGKPQ